MLAVVACNLYYFSYRISHTLNFNALAFSVIFLLAEVHGFVSLWFYFFDLWSPEPTRDPPEPTRAWTVDVLIPTYNEDPELLHRTILAARDMNLPHETWVLDDGNRDEVRRLAERLGVNYIARPDHDHAKAGNINYALQRTQGELVAIFDADHVPKADFLERTIGYFEDDAVGFVQTPHLFYNLGSFQTSGDFRGRKYWDDQQLFFRIIQPGKDHWNAAFFCGSCGVIRRKCLDEVGGLDYRTITEDMHTSLRIQNNGWQSVYHNEHLATGLSPGDLGAYWKQRMRWAVGNLSVMWHDNPLFKRGLSLGQRLSYLSSVWAWTIGPQKVVFYLTPPIMLLTGLYPIAEFDLRLLGLLLGNLAISLIVYKLISGGFARIVRAELYNMINAFMLVAAMGRALFGLGARRFTVTQKGGRSERILAYVVPQIGLILLTYWCILWALLRARHHMAQDTRLMLVAGAWGVYNAMLAVMAARIAWKRVDIRKRFRFPYRLPVSYRVKPTKTAPEIGGIGTAIDIHGAGLGLRVDRDLPEEARIELAIHLPTGDRVDCAGRVLHLKPVEAGEPVRDYGVHFSRLPPRERDRLERFITRYIIPIVFRRMSADRSAWERLRMRLFAPDSRKRRARRAGIQFPITFESGADAARGGWLVTDDLSATGMSVLLAERHPLKEQTGFTLLLPKHPVTGRATFVRERVLNLGGVRMVLYGLQFDRLSEDDRERICELEPYALEEEVSA